MRSLAEFQSTFAGKLFISATDVAAMSVYRNTVMKGLIDALAANYPAVFKLVGEEWFHAAASEFVRRSSPASAALAEFGADFVAFLAEFAPASDLVYLSEVARIDRLWMESYFAADADVLSASPLQGVSGDQLMSTQLTLHPATRLGRFKHSAVSIWMHNHHDHSGELTIDGSDEDASITRTTAGVTVTSLCVIEFRFLTEIQNGATLGEAAMAALAINPEFPLATTLAKLINLNCFSDSARQPSSVGN